MALSGLDIYKLLPKTNCRDCGFPTCLAFALALAKKAVSLDKCPHISEAAKKALEAQAQPPIKLVCIGEGENKVEVGNETVMFRHEEKFHHPCALGFVIPDSLSDAEIKQRLDKISKLQFERIGQLLKPELIAVKQVKDVKRFIDTVKLASDAINLGVVLMSSDVQALDGALSILAGKKPLIYAATGENLEQVIGLAKKYNASIVIRGESLEDLCELTIKANASGFSDIVLNLNCQGSSRKAIWGLTQIRRQALKKANRLLGYPIITVLDKEDPYQEVMEAGDYIAKYSSIVLLNGFEAWAALALLTLRQNIYTDPQKPLQIEPKLYPVGSTDRNSPVLVTTNFSLTYYTVLGEVEASKVPSYILSVDTEGMSVLTAWAAEKFTPDKITESMNKFGVADTVSHKKLVIPGYVAVMSGELEEKAGWQVVVGPKEAAGLPSFLKNL